MQQSGVTETRAWLKWCQLLPVCDWRGSSWTSGEAAAAGGGPRPPRLPRPRGLGGEGGSELLLPGQRLATRGLRVGAGQPCPQDASSTLLVHVRPPHPDSPRLCPAGCFPLGGPCAGPAAHSLPSRPPHCPAHRPSPWGPCRASPVSGRPVDPDGPARGPGNHAGLTRVHHTHSSCCFSWRPPGGLQDIVQGVKFQDSVLGKGN